jgi:hypothetical protein
MTHNQFCMLVFQDGLMAAKVVGMSLSFLYTSIYGDSEYYYLLLQLVFFCDGNQPGEEIGCSTPPASLS